MYSIIYSTCRTNYSTRKRKAKNVKKGCSFLFKSIGLKKNNKLQNINMPFLNGTVNKQTYMLGRRGIQII